MGAQSNRLGAYVRGLVIDVMMKVNYEENILGSEEGGLGLRACVREVVIDGEKKEGGKAEVKENFL